MATRNWFKLRTPGDLLTEPTEKLVFNAPFSVQQLQITNDYCRQIAWRIMTNCPTRLNSADPPYGVLGPNEKQILFITCEPFDNQSTDVLEKGIRFEWVLPPDGAGKAVDHTWFQGVKMIKFMNIEFKGAPAAAAAAEEVQKDQ